MDDVHVQCNFLRPRDGTTPAAVKSSLNLKESRGAGRWCDQFRGVLLIWIIVGVRPVALVGANGSCLDTFLSSIISLFVLPLSGKRSGID